MSDPNPFNLFSSIYKITIVDLPKTQFVPHTNVLYAVAPTRYGPAVVRMTKTKEIPRSIGQILRRNAPTLVKGNRHVVHRRVSGTLDSELRESYQERQTRRAYSFTEEDIMNIIQMGTIPRIKELRVFADIREEMKAERRRQMGVDGLAESTDNNRPKTVEEPKVEQKKVTFDSTKKDATFITGVHITQQMPETVGSQAAKKVTPAESDSDSEDAHSDNEQMQQHILPLNIQGAVRALKHALSNPVSYWRIMEESYLRPTAASHNRFKEVKKNASQNYFDSPGEDYEDQEMTEDQLLNDLNAKAGTEFPTPANTIATPVYTARQRVEYEVKGYREPEKYALKQQDSSKFEELVTSKLMLDGTEKPSELSYLRKGKVTKKKNGLARAKQAGHLKPNTEFDEMSEMMGDVDKKLKLIEADLGEFLCCTGYIVSNERTHENDFKSRCSWKLFNAKTHSPVTKIVR